MTWSIICHSAEIQSCSKLSSFCYSEDVAHMHRSLRGLKKNCYCSDQTELPLVAIVNLEPVSTMCVDIMISALKGNADDMKLPHATLFRNSAKSRLLVRQFIGVYGCRHWTKSAGSHCCVHMCVLSCCDCFKLRGKVTLENDVAQVCLCYAPPKITICRKTYLNKKYGFKPAGIGLNF